VSLRNVGIVYRKELTESLRDRRTLISMIVVPLILMPVVTIGVGTAAVTMAKRAQEETPNIMIIGGQDSPRVRAALQAMPGIHVVPAAPDYAQGISDERLRAAIEIPPGFDAAVAAGQPTALKIYNFQNDMKSEVATEKLERFLGAMREQTVEQRLSSRNLPADLITPFKIDTENVAPPEKVTGTLIGGLLPYFVIILCMTGATYPAIDLTAGEKERGTIETILCSPVSRTHLVLGKFLMVLTASLCTGVLAITSMGASFHAAKSMMATSAMRDNPFNFAIGLKAIAAVFLMVLPLTVLFASALLAIALFAKSYKEAQSYISPLLIVVILPAIAAVIPGVEFDARMALIPILNTSLMCKNIVMGTYHWGSIALVFLSSCVYASIALFVAIRLFKREDVLFRT
jgi:sodium transport system permease protein